MLPNKASASLVSNYSHIGVLLAFLCCNFSNISFNSLLFFILAFLVLCFSSSWLLLLSKKKFIFSFFLQNVVLEIPNNLSYFSIFSLFGITHIRTLFLFVFLIDAWEYTFYFTPIHFVIFIFHKLFNQCLYAIINHQYWI